MNTSPRHSDEASASLAGRSFGYLAVRLGEMVMERGELALAQFDLKPREFDAMYCILNGHGMSQRDLSRRLGLYAPRMVGLIDGLQKRGLVERTVSASDRRRRVLSLTTRGRELLDRATLVATKFEAKLFGDVSPEDLGRFEALVRRVAAALGENQSE